jgi:hypothetical protein
MADIARRYTEVAERVLASAWRSARRHHRRIAGWLTAGTLGAAFVFLLVIGRHRWFDTDEWDALVNRSLFGGHGQSGLLQPHNEHWSTLPILLYRLLFSVFAVRTYVPYLLMVTLAHLLVVGLVWLLLRRLGVDVWVCFVAVAALAFLGAGVDNIIFPWQTSWTLSLAAGFAALLVAPVMGGWSRRDVTVWVFLLLGLASSGIGLTMVGVVVVVQLLRRGLGIALATLAAPAIVYVAWYAAYGASASTPGQEPLRTAIQKVPAFVWHGLTEPVSTTLGFAGSGAVVIVLLGVWAARRARLFDGPWPIALGMALGATISLSLTATRRVQFGTDYASTPRYAYIALVLLVPIAALATDALLRAVPLRGPVIVAGLCLLLLVGVSQIKSTTDLAAQRQADQEGRILATARLARATSQFLYPDPVPVYIPQLTVAKIHALDRNGDLPAITPTSRDRLDALEYVQVVFGPNLRLGTEGTPAATLVGESGVNIQADPVTHCLSVNARSDRPSVRFALTGPVTLATTSERTGQLLLELDGYGEHGNIRELTITGRRRRFLNVNAPGTETVVTIPPLGTTQFCGPALDRATRVGTQ